MLCKHDVNNSSLCSPYRNFSFSDLKKLEILHIKLNSCCLKFDQFFYPDGSSSVHPIVCDNRSCDNPDCKKHRGMKFWKAHQYQIDILNKDMLKPKAWVFTGWKKPLVELSRDFCRKHHRRLMKLLSKYSVSEFSGHMEIKVYSDGMAFLHWHVVSAGFHNLSELRKYWGRQIKYEDAIVPKYLGFYVSKYASKTPFFNSECYRELYHLLVYKTQMHFFSVKLPKEGDIGYSEYKKRYCPKKNVVSLNRLSSEVRNCLMRDSYLNIRNHNPWNKHGKKFYHPYLEPPIEEESEYGIVW
jgi:hypothetical protein